MILYEVVIPLALGLLFLFTGAEGLIRGSSALALRFGISPLVVGLTVVAFGTSSPELVVSIDASLKGNSGITLGNIIGSNICNIALILGISSLIRPLKVQAQVIKREIPIMVLVSILFFIFLLNNEISRAEGFIFLAGIIGYTIITIYLSKIENNIIVTHEFEEGLPKPEQKLWLSLVLTIGGLGLLIWGADIFVEGAVAAAERIGVSQLVIGLTIVAVGTSLPELITSAVAAFKNEADIAIGNIMGSNIFNILLILGTSAVIEPVSSTDINILDLLVMLITALLIWPFSISGFRLNRWEGSFLLTAYTIFLLFHVL